MRFAPAGAVRWRVHAVVGSAETRRPTNQTSEKALFPGVQGKSALYGPECFLFSCRLYRRFRFNLEWQEFWTVSVLLTRSLPNRHRDRIFWIAGLASAVPGLPAIVA